MVRSSQAPPCTTSSELFPPYLVESAAYPDGAHNRAPPFGREAELPKENTSEYPVTSSALREAVVGQRPRKSSQDDRMANAFGAALAGSGGNMVVIRIVEQS
jgi:hypothetical protein